LGLEIRKKKKGVRRKKIYKISQRSLMLNQTQEGVKAAVGKKGAKMPIQGLPSKKERASYAPKRKGEEGMEH